MRCSLQIMWNFIVSLKSRGKNKGVFFPLNHFMSIVIFEDFSLFQKKFQRNWRIIHRGTLLIWIKKEERVVKGDSTER